MDNRDLKIQKLKNIIYNQKIALYHQEIPTSGCPWAYKTDLKPEDEECHSNCRECKREFWEELRNQVKIEVDNL